VALETIPGDIFLARPRGEGEQSVVIQVGRGGPADDLGFVCEGVTEEDVTARGRTHVPPRSSDDSGRETRNRRQVVAERFVARHNGLLMWTDRLDTPRRRRTEPPEEALAR